MSTPTAPATPGTLTITVLDTATIFEGPDTVYRYDLPGTGVTEGWALAAVIDQARELCSLHWPDVEIIIDADESGTEILTRTLLNKGVAAYPTEALRETPLPEDPGEEEIEIRRPTGNGRHRFTGAGLGLRLFHLLIPVVIVLLGGLGWWALDRQAPAGTGAEPGAASVAEGADEATAVTTTAESAATEAADTADTAPPEVVLEHEHLRLLAPAGFRIDDTDGALLATGGDPGLRIHLAADPVHGVPAEAVHREIEMMIDRDPTLDGLRPDPAEPGERVVLRYRELPGDGSEVDWATWIDAGHQLSAGCHTRTTPTLPQKAACRMAVDSLGLNG